MKKLLSKMFLFSWLFWISALLWALFPMGSPIVSMQGDSIEPPIVQVGGTIFIRRNMRVTRKEPVTVIRAVVQGDCSVNCEIIDLSSGNLLLAEGDYIGIKREHILPLSIGPGLWKAKFYINWQDRLGRSHSEPLQELSFTVTK